MDEEGKAIFGVLILKLSRSAGLKAEETLEILKALVASYPKDFNGN